MDKPNASPPSLRTNFMRLVQHKDWRSAMLHALIWGLITGPLVSFMVSGGLDDPGRILGYWIKDWTIMIWALPMVGVTWAVTLSMMFSFLRFAVIPSLRQDQGGAWLFIQLTVWGFGVGFASLMVINLVLNGVFSIHTFTERHLTSLASALGFVGVALAHIFNVAHWNEQRLAQEEARRKELEKIRLESELMNLNMRIRPHFFFNALNTLASLIDKDPDEAQEFLVDLADLFRKSFTHGQDGPICRWEEERQLLDHYLQLEQRRFGDRLKVSIDVEADPKTPFPAFLLQPLVENAVHHGVAKLTHPGEVQLKGTNHNGSWRISLGNSTRGEVEAVKKEGHALAEIEKRLHLMDGSLEIQTQADWFQVSLNWSHTP